MKKLTLVLLAALVGLSVSEVWADSHQNERISPPFLPSDTLFQVSPLSALLVGGYDGIVNYGTVARHGDFGLGTFDKLDGEMVAFDGEFYQITADGAVHRVEPQMTTPFAAVTFFKADKTRIIKRAMTCQQLYAYLDKIRPSANRLYAIKLSGAWLALKTRSVAAQTKPYPPLSTVVAGQSVFNLEQVDATLAGFWMPAYMGQANSAGYHFHALTDDKTAGGHVLDCQSAQIKIELDAIDQFQMVLPANIDELDLDGPK